MCLRAYMGGGGGRGSDAHRMCIKRQYSWLCYRRYLFHHITWLNGQNTSPLGT